jgi:hypothetical protein
LRSVCNKGFRAGRIAKPPSDKDFQRVSNSSAYCLVYALNVSSPSILSQSQSGRLVIAAGAGQKFSIAFSMTIAICSLAMSIKAHATAQTVSFSAFRPQVGFIGKNY